MVATGDLIRGQNYIALRNTITEYMSATPDNDGTKGYGQATASSSDNYVVNQDFITANDINRLYADIARMRIKQVGTNSVSQPVAGLYPVTLGELVAADTGDNVNGISTYDADKGYNDMLSALNTVVSAGEYHKLDDGQADISTQEKTYSIATWNGTKSCRFDVNFGTYSNRRYFFNAGGELRLFFENPYAGVQAKTVQWIDLLVNAIGTLSFKVNDSSISGNGLASSGYTTSFDPLGHSDFPVGNTTYSTVLNFSVAGTRSTTNYTNNSVTIQVRNGNATASQLQFLVTMNDIAAEGHVGDASPTSPYDENVLNTTSCYMGWKRPDGDDFTILEYDAQGGTSPVTYPGIAVTGVSFGNGSAF